MPAVLQEGGAKRDAKIWRSLMNDGPSLIERQLRRVGEIIRLDTDQKRSRC
jgi:hypothetical protein